MQRSRKYIHKRKEMSLYVGYVMTHVCYAVMVNNIPSYIKERKCLYVGYVMTHVCYVVMINNIPVLPKSEKVEYE